MIKNIIFLSLVIFALFILCIGVGITFAQQPATSDSFSNMPFSNVPFSSTPPVNTLSPLSNNSTTFPLLPSQSTTSFLNNNQTFGNSNNFLSNQSIANVQSNIPSMVSSQNINNFSTLPSLYNLTANSVVAVTSFDATNHSISKTGTGFIYSYKGAPSILTVSNLFTGNNDITVTLSDGSSYDSVVDGYDPLITIVLCCTIPPFQIQIAHIYYQQIV